MRLLDLDCWRASLSALWPVGVGGRIIVESGSWKEETEDRCVALRPWRPSGDDWTDGSVGLVVKDGDTELAAVEGMLSKDAGFVFRRCLGAWRKDEDRERRLMPLEAILHYELAKVAKYCCSRPKAYVSCGEWQSMNKFCDLSLVHLGEPGWHLEGICD